MDLVIALVALAPLAAGDPPVPADLFTSMGTQALTILPWIIGAVVAAVPVTFAVVGIRKGLSWFWASVKKG